MLETRLPGMAGAQTPEIDPQNESSVNQRKRQTLLLLIILLPLLAGTLATGWSGVQRSAGYRGRTACLAAAITASSLALLLWQTPS
ncbi:MAG: hypothetical protein ABIQ90_17785, partial [Polaromonas sp.]